MADKRAEEIIKLAGRHDTETINIRNQYQEVADYMIPRENQIVTKTALGGDRTSEIYDPTAMLDLQDMVSGMSAAFFPPGELAFGTRIKDRQVNELPHIKRYLHLLTQITHDELFASNFMLQLNETLTSLIGFGTGCLFSEFLLKPGMPLGLNFRDWDIAFYTFDVNSHRRPNSIILRLPYTAKQAESEFKDKAGDKIKKAMENPETQNKVFKFLHSVRPREEVGYGMTDSMNMPYESLYINVEEKIVVQEGGFEQFPYAIPRWMVSSNEKWGRGQGLALLSAVKQLQQMHADLIECSNKHVNPPREVLDHFEGGVRVKPGALNYVKEKGTIRGLDQASLGNFPIGKDLIQIEQDIIHRGFFTDVFAPLAHLTGDRRNQLEIMERIKQAMKKLALPVYRLQTELFTPTITRVILLLIKHGRIPLPPAELQGKSFQIEYIGELALAMKDQQARAFQQFAGVVAELDPVFPGAKDSISMERALPDIAISYGVKYEHLATEEEIAQKQQAREQAALAQQQLQMAEVAGKAYKNTSKAAEEESPAAQLQEALTEA